jgi:acyl phosphate:glycerol-3-phosphate acyltransferase
VKLILALLMGLVCYAIGCLVGAYYIVRWRRGVDVRASGSGNAGARNVFRSGDRVAAALTLLWDAAKGAAAMLLTRWLLPGDDAALAIAFVAVIVGHIWPVPLRFHGGKGVATAIGAALVVAPELPDAAKVLWSGLAAGCALVVLAHQRAFLRREAPKVEERSR